MDAHHIKLRALVLQKNSSFITSGKLSHIFTATFGAIPSREAKLRKHHVPVQFWTYRVGAHAVATHGGFGYFLENQETSCCGHYVVFSCVGAFK